ncbi:MAG TPA: peptidoglycan-binding domain-containing protein [Bryobacteraceae bacterium]
MRCLLALMVMATALSAQQPPHPAPAKLKAKPKTSAPAVARTGVKPTASKKPASNPTEASKSNSKSTAQRAHSTTSHTTASRRRVASRRGPPKPVGQQHPDPNRYQEIQKALQERGYFKGEPNGEWKDDSTDALKRFQADQKLPNDGKVNALTLIGLGLGPKHDSGPITPPPPSTLPPATAPPISPETIPAPGKPE